MTQIIDAYRQKAGSDFNVHRFYAGIDEIGAVKMALNISSLFNPKTLVVVEGALSDYMESMRERAAQLKEEKNKHLMLFHEVMDASAKKYLTLWEPHLAQSQEFEELKGEKREQWIAKEAAERGVALAPEHLRALALSNMDSWALAQEIEKIAVLGNESAYTAAKKSFNVFDFGDIFFTDKKRAAAMLPRLLAQGEDEFTLFSYLVNRSRALIAVKQCAIEKKPVPAWLGLHPFVVKKTETLARMLTPAQCANFMRRFFEEDSRIKIGLSRPQDSLLQMLAE